MVSKGLAKPHYLSQACIFRQTTGQSAHQKPEGDMPLREKFRAARCSSPGCSSAHRIGF